MLRLQADGVRALSVGDHLPINLLRISTLSSTLFIAVSMTSHNGVTGTNALAVG
jgi:hypothetical protein